MGTAYLKSATPSSAINGFKKTGIADIDIHVFDEDDFVPSSVTEITIDQTNDNLTIDVSSMNDLSITPMNDCNSFQFCRKCRTKCSYDANKQGQFIR